MFTSCTNLTSVIIPTSVTTIGIFHHKITMTTVIILPSLGWYAFSQSALKSVTIPTSITNIDIEVFGECLNLVSVTIPTSVTTIGTITLH